MQETKNSVAEEVEKELLTVFRRNTEKWMRISISILRNREDAEDALHEAFRRVLRRAPRFASSEDLRLYLGRAIGNTAFELYKMRKRERKQYAPVLERLLTRSALEHQDPFRPDLLMEEAEDRAELEGKLRLLRQAVDNLPQKQQEAVRLTMLGEDEASYRSLEATSGIPRSTIRHRSQQGIDALRRYMAQEMQMREMQVARGDQKKRQGGGAPTKVEQAG
ncbi:MAG: sigma-70 family RNA polymerase sigma factor [Acidobacteriota bacterium]|jgi:RNA polymerase sigma factor (sigma-70 family)|nr:sigma-70 family RNA polymerase sigma factor [Acidobacteriota bacterium]